MSVASWVLIILFFSPSDTRQLGFKVLWLDEGVTKEDCESYGKEFLKAAGSKYAPQYSCIRKSPIGEVES